MVSLESSAPKEVSNQISVVDPSFGFPSNFRYHRSLGMESHFDILTPVEKANDILLKLVNRVSVEHNTSRSSIIHWLSDISWYAPGIIFVAGPQTRTDTSIHVIAVSSSERMMDRVQTKVVDKPPGVWAYYTTLQKSSSGLLNVSSHSMPFWLRGILAGEHFFVTTDDGIYRLFKELRIESINLTKAAPEQFLGSVAFMDVYRKVTGRMPSISTYSPLFLRLDIEAMGLSPIEILAESDMALRNRNVKGEYRKKTIHFIGSFLGVTKEELSKYHSGIHTMKKREKKATPASLPRRKIRKTNGN
jgi:hypothetical protein